MNIGATTGATAFCTVFAGDTVEQVRSGGPFRRVSKNAFSYLLTLRLIPLFPFFVVNLVSGLTRVSNLYGHDGARHHSRLIRLCLCRPPTGYDQYARDRIFRTSRAFWGCWSVPVVYKDKNQHDRTD